MCTNHQAMTLLAMSIVGCGGQVQLESARPSDASGSAASAGGAGQGYASVTGGSTMSSANGSVDTGGSVTTSAPPQHTANLVTMTQEEWDKVRGDACTTVQDASQSCTYALPVHIPFDGISLVYELGGTYDNAILVLPASDAKCPEINGWYFDPSHQTKTTIALCPSTCERIRQDPNAAIEILLKCHRGPTIN